MHILSAENISKAYTERILFDEISLAINDGDKIGLIGINGTGKSTFLKIIAGVESSDKGKISASKNILIEYLSQTPVFDDEATILEQIFKGDSPVMNLLREYENTMKAFNENTENAELGKKLLTLTQRMDTMKAWTIENEAKTILSKLGVEDFAAKMGTLSGGQRKRVALASVLINPCDLLILDEPTNHLDNETIDWLEKYLKNRKGALLMVTHDRYFLGRVCNKIIELDHGKLYSYQANYTKYLEIKAEREESEQSSERKRQSILRKELAWIKRGARARSTKQKARIERYENLKNTKAPETHGKVEMKVGASRLGKKTIELEHLGKDFSGKKIIDDFNYILRKDDRIGILGPNGSGKTTLLNIISGRLQPDRGELIVGETVKIGYFSQENTDMDDNLRVIEYIREEGEYLQTGEGLVSASQMLERFLFPPSLQWTPISKLSGGEKRRLYLLRVLMGAPNVILLDEPTNDLDIQTLTILESYLEDFPGAVIAVSHDRYFIDRIMEKVFVFQENSPIEIFDGNYSDYYSKKLEEQSDRMKTENIRKKSEKEEVIEESRKSRALKFTFKEQKEFEEIDEKIARLEAEIKKMDTEINDASQDYERLKKILSTREELENELNKTMERWVYLNELAERIAENSKKDN